MFEALSGIVLHFKWRRCSLVRLGKADFSLCRNRVAPGFKRGSWWRLASRFVHPQGTCSRGLFAEGRSFSLQERGPKRIPIDCATKPRSRDVRAKRLSERMAMLAQVNQPLFINRGPGVLGLTGTPHPIKKQGSANHDILSWVALGVGCQDGLHGKAIGHLLRSFSLLQRRAPGALAVGADGQPEMLDLAKLRFWEEQLGVEGEEGREGGRGGGGKFRGGEGEGAWGRVVPFRALLLQPWLKHQDC